MKKHLTILLLLPFLFLGCEKYEAIDESTRFNKSTGEVEILLDNGEWVVKSEQLKKLEELKRLEESRRKDLALNEVQTESGLKYVDIKEGKGASPQSGQRVSVHYTGWLYDENQPENKGKMFDSSVKKGKPFGFVIGVGSVIEGWEEGVLSMRLGGKRKLIISPHLGYGERGIGPIPPNSILMFEVELLNIQ
jgi:FKBP-type peptidyl-prolyl cis-trans isomerase